MRYWVACALFAAACSSSKVKPADMSVADLATGNAYLLGGTYATRLRLSVGLHDDGGAQPSAGTLDELFILDSFTQPNMDGSAGVFGMWHPCSVALPGPMLVPYPRALETIDTQTSNGELTGKGEGATYTQGPVAFAFGTCLANPATDPLPDGSMICPAPTDGSNRPCNISQRGCAIPTTDMSGQTWPGVPVTVPAGSGLALDPDVLYVAGRVIFSLTGTPHSGGGLDGMTAATTIEWRVLACHLRSGATCTAAQVAEVDADKPVITVDSGTLLAHQQPSYYNCAQFNADVDGSLSGFEVFDGGVPDMSLKSMSFSDVQSDMDALGCATCHDTFPKGKMRIVYQPWTSEQIHDNYQAVLPWIAPTTMAGAPMPGGRFVNQAPVPFGVRERWLSWIAAGAPF